MYILHAFSNLIKKEILFFSFFALMLVLTIIFPERIHHFPSYVDWNTIISLTVLILLSNGFKESGFFEWIAEKLIGFFTNEKTVALFFVIMTLILSTFLTNDITLFIVVPLTISLQKILKNDLSKLVIFEAIAANVGSTLTPIGNPQNLFLWHQWKIPFFDFIVQLSPLFVLLASMLFLFTIAIFKNDHLVYKGYESEKRNKPLFVLTSLLMCTFITSLQWANIDLIILILVVACYLLFCRTIFLKTDYFLLLTFVTMFIDFNLLTKFDFINSIPQLLHLEEKGNLFIFSSLLSQVISNVPASIFIAHLSTDFRTIAYGVNVGGQGFLIGSLANLIALRILGDKKTFITFHYYSVPFFIISAAIVYVFLLK